MGKPLNILMLIMLAGCGTVRKTSVSQSCQSSVSTTRNTLCASASTVVLDTTFCEGLEVIRTRMEFFAVPDTCAVSDLRKSHSVSGFPIPAIRAGAVKNIDMTILRHSSTRTGLSMSRADTLHAESAVSASSAADTRTDASEPVPDPLRWRYIFFTALLALGVILLSKIKYKLF